MIEKEFLESYGEAYLNGWLARLYQCSNKNDKLSDNKNYKVSDEAHKYINESIEKIEMFKTRLVEVEKEKSNVTYKLYEKFTKREYYDLFVDKYFIRKDK